jgi:hypothetical protein
MSKLGFHDVFAAVNTLSLDEKHLLLKMIQWDLDQQMSRFTREQALQELKALQTAGIFEHTESLYGMISPENGDPIDLDAIQDEIRTLREQPISLDTDGELDDGG